MDRWVVARSSVKLPSHQKLVSGWQDCQVETIGRWQGHLFDWDQTRIDTPHHVKMSS